MQPLISPVDHESRHNSYRGEEVPRPSEQTPLLHRFPASQVRDSGNTHATIVITLLLVILISGVIIGIYLLIVQSNSENILPPVDIPLQMVSLSQWSSNNSRVLTSPAFRAHHIVVVQTDSRECHSALDCKHLLTDMQKSNSDDLPYNFLLSSNGQTFEALGWRRPSPLYPEVPDALVLAFIGNFTEAPPTKAQLAEARNFYAESVSLQRLDPSYSILGKSTKYTPKYLFKALSTLPQWDKKLSDKYR